MVGITSYGAYIPMWRLPLAAIAGGGRRRRAAGAEKAVANCDEDAVTMAVAAAIDCLRGFDRASVDAVLFASTSYPFKEKQGAAIVAKALDLRRDVVTADFGDSLRAGTTALRAGARRGQGRLGEARARRRQRHAAWRRRARRSSATSATARRRSWSATTTSRRRSTAHTASPTRSSTSGAPRAIRSSTRGRTASSSTTATAPACVEAVRGLLDEGRARRRRTSPSAVALRPRRSAATPARSASSASTRDAGCRTRSSASSATRAPRSRRCCSPRRSRAPRPGERLLVVGYGDGADALALSSRRRTSSGSRAAAASPGISRAAPSCASYDMYLRFRQLLATEHDRRAGAGLSATKHFRDRDEDMSLLGQRCRSCGQVQFPLQRVCFTLLRAGRVRDGAALGPHRHGAVVHLRQLRRQPDPPLVGEHRSRSRARALYLQMTDARPKEVKLGMPVELTLPQDPRGRRHAELLLEVHAGAVKTRVRVTTDEEAKP